MTDEPRIRVASADDLDGIMALENEAFTVSAWSRENMEAEVASEWGVYLVVEQATAEPGTTLLGYAGLRAVGVEGDVQTIAIAESARGSGLGRRLFKRLEHEARERGVRELFLEVRADNIPARALYDSEGFAEIGIRPRYYQPEDVDAIVMKKELR